MALIGAVAGVLLRQSGLGLEPAIYVLDTLLIGVWVVIGAEKALALDLPYSAAVFPRPDHRDRRWPAARCPLPQTSPQR